MAVPKLKPRRADIPMLRPKNKRFAGNPRQGRRWANWSRAYRQRHPICERCGWDLTEHVHHVVPVSVDPSRTYDEANARGLCRPCHADVHRGEPLDVEPNRPRDVQAPPAGRSMYEPDAHG